MHELVCRMVRIFGAKLNVLKPDGPCHRMNGWDCAGRVYNRIFQLRGAMILAATVRSDKL